VTLPEAFAQKVLNEDHPTEDLAEGLTLKALANSSLGLLQPWDSSLEIQ
jgi:hypothetical protein